MEVKLVSQADAALLSRFYIENQSHLERWEPQREEGYHSIKAWETRLFDYEKDQEKGLSAKFLLLTEQDLEVVAVCTLNNIVHGVFQACHLGYAVAERYQGMGMMRHLCSEVIDYAFNELKLNRIMANYMPSNLRSEKLLESLNFAKEGLAKNYLKINGKWEDHILTSLINSRNI